VPAIDDAEIDCLLVAPRRTMARYVESGALEAGITGHDWVVETNADVVETCGAYLRQAASGPRQVGAGRSRRLGHSHPRRDLEGKKPLPPILVRITEKYLAGHVVSKARVEFSLGRHRSGKSRSSPTRLWKSRETGSSLRANRLRILDTFSNPPRSSS